MADVPNDKMKQPLGQGSMPDWSDAFADQSLPKCEQEKLAKGEVVIEVQESGTEKRVTGKILLDDSAEKIWPILANPFEFANGIYPRMGKVQIIENEKQHSRMRCTVGLGLAPLLPDIVAVVDTDYVQGKRIDFHKVGGTLKDLSGGWTLTPREGGRTEVSYWMNIDPGIPVPAWIIRKGISMELPKTLKAVRHRLNELHNEGKPAAQSILAAEI